MEQNGKYDFKKVRTCPALSVRRHSQLTIVLSQDDFKKYDHALSAKNGTEDIEEF